MPTVTYDQYTRVLNRVTILERTLNDVLVAMEQFVELGQVSQLVTLLQTQVDDALTRVIALENRVADIENEPVT